MCAGYPDGEQSPCFADGGAPMVEQSTGNLVGILSFFKGCQVAGYPSVFTEISYYIDWINDIINSN